MSQTTAAVLHHTCFIVRDLESAAQRLSDSLGVGPWNIWTIQPAESKLRGTVTPMSFRVALAAAGGGNFELITPHSGRSALDEHLEQFGEGFHHICLTYPSYAAAKAAKADLIAQGRELIQEADAGEVFTFSYFRFPEIGSAVEVLFLDGSQLPAPERVIGAN